MTITIRANLDDVALAGLSVRAVSEFELFSQEDAILIELAVCEALNNAIIHGLPDRPDEFVQLEIAHASDRIVFSISDCGPGMPEGIERIGYEQRISLASRGRGIAIMRDVMDSVTYERRDGRSVLKLVKRTAALAQGTT
ncbi:ATP-binding protein [Solidesulfovibrio fructosivorans]|uniref:ATP-binding protein n=1 Tax=Solidesulfovibrio fructosivorans TaxID=878 RepID=UPI00130522B7|nr:ATP-binding protein [Solidesulfovibrio fructosivorans]